MTGASMLDPAALQAGVDPTTVALGLLTQLGDVWFLTTIAVLLYWLGPRTPLVGDGVDRSRQATVLAAVFLGVALSVALKTSFGVARPAGGIAAPTVPALTLESVTAWLAGADGPAFPSGHAVLSAIGWGALAWAIRWRSTAVRAAGASAVVLLVASTRVALDLHTPTQVAAGLAVGLVGLLAVVALRTPQRAFAAAAASALVGIAAVAPVPEGLVVLGLASGAFVAWYRLEGALVEVDRSGAVLATAVGAATVLPLLVGLAVFETLHPLFLVGVSGLVGAVALALPLVGEQVVEYRSGVR